METEDFFQFEIIINVSVGSICFIWIPMLWVYGHYNFFLSFSAGINFRRQNLTPNVGVCAERVKLYCQRYAVGTLRVLGQLGLHSYYHLVVVVTAWTLQCRPGGRRKAIKLITLFASKITFSYHFFRWKQNVHHVLENTKQKCCKSSFWL